MWWMIVAAPKAKKKKSKMDAAHNMFKYFF